MGGDQLHIGGERAAAFRDLIGDLGPRRVLLVGVDVAKASWFVLGCDLHGSVVIDGAKVPADRAGLGQLRGLLDQAGVRVDAQLVVVGVEAAGHYHQTLAAHLADRGDLLLRLVNPASVAAVRKMQLNRRRKTDWLDAAAICDLLVRGEGSLFLLSDDAATALRPLWNGRKDLVNARARLRLQVLALVDCLWPGLTAHERNGHRPGCWPPRPTGVQLPHDAAPGPGGGRAMGSPAAVGGRQRLHAGEGLVGELEHRACSRARERPEARRYRPAPLSTAKCGCSTDVERLVKATFCLVDGVISAWVRCQRS